MSEKWTKGPWRVYPPGASVPHYDVCARVVSDRPSGRAVHYDPISDADAHLIAAAPDLYEALASIENDDGRIPAAIWAKREAALKKARGDT